MLAVGEQMRTAAEWLGKHIDAPVQLFDRLLGLRYGAEAVLAIEAGARNVMVALDGDVVHHVPLADIAGRARLVPLDSGGVRTARSIGTCLGDRP